MATREELSNRYLQMSQKYMRQAQEELDKGDLAQGSEKAWGAVAEYLKSIAAQRGWNHKSHPLLEDIATQIYMEFGQPRIFELFELIERAHFNYYEHRFDRDAVQMHLGYSHELLNLLGTIFNSSSRRFTPANREQERRLQRLTQYQPDQQIDADLDISTLPPVEFED